MESKIFNGGHITKSSPVLSTTIFGSDRKRAGVLRAENSAGVEEMREFLAEQLVA